MNLSELGARKALKSGYEDLFDAEAVFFGVNADGVVLGFGDVDGDAVFEEAELFEALGELERAGGEGVEAVESGSTVRIEAEVLPHGCGAGRVAVERNR